MIRLGLRLAFNGGKEAVVRLLVTVAAVALGVGLLLVALSGINALNAQNRRSAWLNTFGPAVAPGVKSDVVPAPDQTTGTDPLWWEFDTDHYRGKTIDRVDVAATGSTSPVPPGIPQVPGPGQFYASPALSRLLRSTPANQLGDRFPGQQVGTIGASALPSPDSLIIVIGHPPAELANQGANAVTGINTNAVGGGPIGWDSHKLQVILAVGALALLFPVLVFIGTATRLSAARREQRFAAMRLVGASPRQVAIVSAVEASVAAAGGVVVGFAAFLLLRPVLTHVPFTGAPFAPGDLSLSVFDVLAVVVGVPLAAVAAARLAMRRVVISPLGVSRRTTPPSPRAWRVVPLLAGIAELAYFVKIGHPTTTGEQIEAYFSGCLLMMVGLVVAGPWLTMIASRVMARRTGKPAVLIAGRRLADDPRGAFRSISGLIVALFVTSVSVGVITTMLDYQSTSAGTAAGATLLQRIDPGPGGPVPADGPKVRAVTSVPPAQLAALRAIPGVKGVALARMEPFDPSAGPTRPSVLMSCDELAQTPAVGRCSVGAQVAAMSDDLTVEGVGNRQHTTMQATVWPAASVTAAQLPGLPLYGVVVATNGSAATVEHVRTTLDTDWPDQAPASTLNEVRAESLRQIIELQQLTNVVIVISLVIAGCSLAVSVTSGISDRKRPFSLLRLAGAPVRVLRRVVGLEAAVPLCAIAVVSAGAGLVAADLFLHSQLGETLRPPGPTYYVIVLVGLAASLAIIASTLPLIERITGPETARNE